MNCPRCKEVTTKEQVKDLKVAFETDNCPGCGGLWFDGGELSQIDKVIEPVFFEIRKIPCKTTQMETLLCPSCNNGQVLDKRLHPRDKYVVIDHCPSCMGIWLDRNSQMSAIIIQSEIDGKISLIFSTHVDEGRKKNVA